MGSFRCDCAARKEQDWHADPRRRHPIPAPPAAFHGHGCRVRPSGNSYDGEHADGAPEGRWTLRDARTRGVYVGELRDGRKHGRGEETWTAPPSGAGPFADPLVHAASCTYAGEYNNGDPHGTERIAAADGRSYEGEWAGGRRHGTGRAVLIPTEDRGEGPRRMYIGGPGSMYRAFTYEGGWKGGRPDGTGTFRRQDGSEIKMVPPDDYKF